jgi:undecaprenyl-diphosphatase
MPAIREIVGKIEFALLAAALVVAGGAWAFMELAETTREAESHVLDRRILLAFRSAGEGSPPIGPSWLSEAVRDVTSLGSATVLAFVTIATVIYLLITGKRAAALFVLLAVAGGQILSSMLKLVIDRARPDIVPHLAEVHTASFPSGHAMLSAVTYLTLGALAARIVPGRIASGYILGLAMFLTLAVGLSRIYLGVHWPSDVLAGWCAGAAWAMLCWLVAQVVLRRGGWKA